MSEYKPEDLDRGADQIKKTHKFYSELRVSKAAIDRVIEYEKQMRAGAQAMRDPEAAKMRIKELAAQKTETAESRSRFHSGEYGNEDGIWG